LDAQRKKSKETSDQREKTFLGDVYLLVGLREHPADGGLDGTTVSLGLLARVGATEVVADHAPEANQGLGVTEAREKRQVIDVDLGIGRGAERTALQVEPPLEGPGGDGPSVARSTVAEPSRQPDAIQRGEAFEAGQVEDEKQAVPRPDLDSAIGPAHVLGRDRDRVAPSGIQRVEICLAQLGKLGVGDLSVEVDDGVHGGFTIDTTTRGVGVIVHESTEKVGLGRTGLEHPGELRDMELEAGRCGCLV
jgi:hypothetical protein